MRMHLLRTCKYQTVQLFSLLQKGRATKCKKLDTHNFSGQAIYHSAKPLGKSFPFLPINILCFPLSTTYRKTLQWISTEKNFRWELWSLLHKNPITPKCLNFQFQAWFLKRRNAVFHANLVTTVLNILFQEVCIPQRIDKKRRVLSALYHQFKRGPSQQRTGQARGEACCPVWRGKPEGQFIMRSEGQFVWSDQARSYWSATFAKYFHSPLQAVVHKHRRRTGMTFLFWLAANDPPDLCWDKATSSYDCQYKKGQLLPLQMSTLITLPRSCIY